MKPLHEHTDAELRDGITRSAENTTFYYADYRAELERRAAEAQARWSRRLSLASLAVAAAAVVLTVLLRA